MLRLWSTPIIIPRPMRMMVITGSNSSSQMYMMRTSALLPPKGVSTTGSKFIRS